MVEDVLRDCARAYPFRALSLRYFNPIGADPLLRTGPRPQARGPVMNEIMEAARNGRTFSITGTDWPTRDGSGLRDYIHVWDLARAHVQAVRRFDAVLPVDGSCGYDAVDVGTGRGTTVIELLAAFRGVTGRPLDVVRTAARPGDLAGIHTRSERCRELLQWAPTLSLEDAIRDAVRWTNARDGSTSTAERGLGGR